MNVEIGAEAALIPEKEYIKGIFVAVYIESFCKITVTYLSKVGDKQRINRTGTIHSLISL